MIEGDKGKQRRPRAHPSGRPVARASSPASIRPAPIQYSSRNSILIFPASKNSPSHSIFLSTHVHYCLVMDDLRHLASRNLQDLVSAGSIHPPISAFDLLAKFISLPSASLSGITFRLTDLRKLEDILEEFSVHWDAGTISVLRDDSGLSLMQVSLGANHSATNRKRKRLIDEDADSAEEEEATKRAASLDSKPSAYTSLNNLSKDMQEIYSLLQQGTARQKLLAEQVRSLIALQGDRLTRHSSFVLTMPLSLSALTLRRLTAPRHVQQKGVREAVLRQ